MTSKLTVESASLRVNNRNDENREYDIVCAVEIDNSGNLLRVTEGNINSLSGQNVASFNVYDPYQGLSVTFRVPAAEQADALAAINAFIESAKALATEKFSSNIL